MTNAWGVIVRRYEEGDGKMLSCNPQYFAQHYTRAEAASRAKRRQTVKEIERAINLISEGEIDYSGIYDYELNERVTEVILAALREQAEREKGCFWCLDVSLNDVRINEVRVNINCCPMCGRRLEVQHE